MKMAETVIGYVFDNKGYHTGGQYFEGTMENIASFIMINRQHDTMVTDVLDNMIAKSFAGGFLDSAPYIRKDLLKELEPMQLGEKEPVEIEYQNDNELTYEGWCL